MMKILEIIMAVSAGLFLLFLLIPLAVAIWTRSRVRQGEKPIPVNPMKKFIHFLHCLFLTIRFNYYENRMRRQGLDWLGRPLLLAFLFLILAGCQHAVPTLYIAPSVTATATSLHATQDSISTAHTALTNAQADAEALAADIPLVDAAKWSALTNHLSLAEIAVVTAQTNAAVTQTNLVSFDTAVTNQTATLNKTAQQLNYETTKYQAAVGLIWKWRLWFLGLLALVVGYLFLKYTSKGAALAATIAAKLP